MSANSIRVELLVRIFSGSATMVGICMGGISLFHLINIVGKLTVVGDDLLALDALVFLLACTTAFWALRGAHARQAARLEKLADGLFLTGLTLMVGVCGLLVVAIADFGDKSVALESKAETDASLSTAPAPRPENHLSPTVARIH